MHAHWAMQHVDDSPIQLKLVGFGGFLPDMESKITSVHDHILPLFLLTEYEFQYIPLLLLRQMTHIYFSFLQVTRHQINRAIFYPMFNISSECAAFY